MTPTRRPLPNRTCLRESAQANPVAEENDPDAPDQVVDPARAKKDAEVGGFYLKSGDYQGALLRFKDATAADPTNVEAIFGLAETQRMLKKNAEAARNYQLYLDIVPNGPEVQAGAQGAQGAGIRRITSCPEPKL